MARQPAGPRAEGPNQATRKSGNKDANGDWHPGPYSDLGSSAARLSRLAGVAIAAAKDAAAVADADRAFGVIPDGLVAALLFASLSLYRGPGRLIIDGTKGLVTRAGSLVPLIRNVTVFSLHTPSRLPQHVIWTATSPWR